MRGGNLVVDRATYGDFVLTTSARSNQQAVRRLFEIRNRFDSNSSREKLALLETVKRIEARTSAELERLHTALCFIRAFPDSQVHYRLARSQLRSFEYRVAKLRKADIRKLWDSGIVGTAICYAFSYEVASWMARRTSGSVSIDWQEIVDTTRLDELLLHLLQPSEEEYFDSGLVSSREWIEQAAAQFDGTDFDWLLVELRRMRISGGWSHLYNEAELPLVWDLSASPLSKTHNTAAVRRVHVRRSGMRARSRAIKAEIMRPLDSLRLLSPRAGSKLLDVAMASLAVRHRETNHFNHANHRETYLVDVGEGVSIAVFGLREECRYPLECTMGYLILSNGVPIGYGGASAVFRQANTGINIFDDYRGGEASFLWTQVMRVYHALFGCTRFIANPYQFGSDNYEALKSGAFWFYYRLGFRPVSPDIRALARRESNKIRRNPKHRSGLQTLRRLASCDMHLTLPGARASDLFEERWLETSSMLATKALAAAGQPTREGSAQHVADRVARDLGLRSLSTWTRCERRGYKWLAPFVAAAKPAAWPADAKRSMKEVLRAKGGRYEASYARLIGEHDHFLSALRASCRRAETR